MRHLGEEGSILIKDFIVGRGCEPRTPRELINFFDGVESEDLKEINGIGDKMAESFIDWFEDEESRQLLEKLSEGGVVFLKEDTSALKSDALSGKSFVLTGSLQNLTRDDAKDLIRRVGGKPSSSVSSKTDFVVVGRDPGSKAEKAEKLGVKIISEEEFQEIIKR